MIDINIKGLFSKVLIDRFQSTLNQSSSQVISSFKKLFPFHEPILEQLSLTEYHLFVYCISLLEYLNKSQNDVSLDSVGQLSSKSFSNCNGLDSAYESLGYSNLDKVAVLKLNGGLGTSMGCDYPKGFVNVFNTRSFIDLFLDQIHYLNETYKQDIPFLFMNSHYTHAITQSRLKGIRNCYSFEQASFPRIDCYSNKPLQSIHETDHGFSPIGHGDVFFSLYSSGLITKLLEKGIEYLFVSNIDNLGAVLSPKILGYLIKYKYEFLVEITAKCKADIKGGGFVEKDGKLFLLESAQVNSEDILRFQNPNNFPYFNTNNCWIHLPTLFEKLKDGFLTMPLILNKKKVDHFSVIQFEFAMAAAISNFNHSHLVVVDRSRFIPVKHTSDLFLLQSDFFSIDDNGFVLSKDSYMNGVFPKVTLGKDYLSINQYESLCSNIPSMVECSSLIVEGLIEFSSNIKIKGNVELRNLTNKKIILKDNCFDDDIFTF